MSEQNAAAGEAILASICGATLSSVQFVLNYLILGFDEKGALTTLVWPEVTRDGSLFTFPAPGYRDALCAIITQTVESAHVSHDETILVRFRDGSRLRIPLRIYEGPGERAIFAGPKHVLYTW